MRPKGRLAVIPARGGSKRIPNKNVRRFAGRPMIEYAIGAAQASGLFEHIVVSTDCAEIAAAARTAGAELPFLRPAALAGDHTGTVPVVAHAVQACRDLGWSFGAVCCLYPAVPLLPAGALAEALALFEAGACSYVFPVLAYASPIQRALQRDVGGASRPFFPEQTETRTQDLVPAFHDAGQFYWGGAESWLRGLSLHGNACTLVLPEDSVVDIDTPADWARAEALFRERHHRLAAA